MPRDISNTLSPRRPTRLQRSVSVSLVHPHPHPHPKSMYGLRSPKYQFAIFFTDAAFRLFLYGGSGDTNLRFGFEDSNPLSNFAGERKI
jgi:hypothetical protein